MAFRNLQATNQGTRFQSLSKKFPSLGCCFHFYTRTGKQLPIVPLKTPVPSFNKTFKSRLQETIETKLLIISDTHGRDFTNETIPREPVDVAIHCGDLTRRSKLEDFKTSIQLLKKTKAPLKLVIPGNHDFSMDIPLFKKFLAFMNSSAPESEVWKSHGEVGQAMQLFAEARDAGIVLLEERNHEFVLSNGALLKVFASPYVPTRLEWGFAYDPRHDHEWNIGKDVDVVITHSPPKGVFDYTPCKKHISSANLFKAVARCRPLLHCFGHVHDEWGAHHVTWRDTDNEYPNYETDIDHDKSVLVETLVRLAGEVKGCEGPSRMGVYTRQRHCAINCTENSLRHLKRGEQTLFVNGALMKEDGTFNFPWIVTLDLPKARRHGSGFGRTRHNEQPLLE